MNQCLVCSKEFKATDKRHRYCGNTCVARVYGFRKKMRDKLNAALNTMQTPEDLKAFDASLEMFLGLPE